MTAPRQWTVVVCNTTKRRVGHIYDPGDGYLCGCNVQGTLAYDGTIEEAKRWISRWDAVLCRRCLDVAGRRERERLWMGEKG